ncbi:MAG: hypothetical protein N2Z22_11765 [Turneriella sp.]|nr:hypothetical protein [Turneriella sp.]
MLLLTSFAALEALVDGSDTEVPATRRLADYLNASELPPDNRLLAPDDPPLENIPRIAGDASRAATILGFTKETVRNGSLEIYFTVAVRQAGSYSFRTHLLDANLQRGIEVMTNAQLQPGTHALRFRFFGRALHKIGHGPYTLRGILGEKLPDDGGAPGALEFYSKHYKTRAYSTAQFSNAVYDSPEKRARIRSLKQEIEQERRKSVTNQRLSTQ